MCSLHISLLGKLSIRVADQSGEYEANVEGRRAQELLCYLLLHRDRTHEREKLATLMWPDCATDQSKRYLRQTIWQIQSALNHESHQDEHLLLVYRDSLGINPLAIYWLDTAEFDKAFVAVEKIHGRELTRPQAEDLRNSTRLYRGDLLEDWYCDWCVYPRERYQFIFLAMLDRLLQFSEENHDYEGGLFVGRQILGYDRAREQTHRQLMRLHYLAGNRTAAIRQYEACVADLHNELGVEPANSTIKLYQQICADEAGAAFDDAEDHYRHLADAHEMVQPEICQQLERLSAALGQLQDEVLRIAHSLRYHGYQGP